MPKSLPEVLRSVAEQHDDANERLFLQHLANALGHLSQWDLPGLPGRWDQVEQLYPLKSPGKLDLKKHPNTLRRWAKEGLDGRDGKVVFLETTYRGRFVYTSKERVLAFYRRLNGIKA